jgi:hypothetical protein
VTAGLARDDVRYRLPYFSRLPATADRHHSRPYGHFGHFGADPKQLTRTSVETEKAPSASAGVGILEFLDLKPPVLWLSKQKHTEVTCNNSSQPGRFELPQD